MDARALHLCVPRNDRCAFIGHQYHAATGKLDLHWEDESMPQCGGMLNVPYALLRGLVYGRTRDIESIVVDWDKSITFPTTYAGDDSQYARARHHTATFRWSQLEFARGPHGGSWPVVYVNTWNHCMGVRKDPTLAYKTYIIKLLLLVHVVVIVYSERRR